MIEPVEIRARDGVVLRGELRRAGADWAILVHDRGEDLDAWARLPAVLADDGLSVLAFDLRGHGGSEGEADGSREGDDLEDVVRFVRALGAERVFLGAAGASAGAALAVGADTAAALFALAPAGLAEEVADAPSLPKLMIVPAGDPRQEEEASALQRRLCGWALVVRVPVSEPGLALLRSSWLTNVQDYIVRFLCEARAGFGARR